MAITRLGKSGNGIHFIDDQGNAYVTSTMYMKRLMEGKVGSGFLVLTLLPNKVNPDRFPKSPVWNPEEGTRKVEEDVTNNNDALSNKVLKKQGEVLVKDVQL